MAPAGLKARCGQMRETLYVHQRGVVFYPGHGFFQRVRYFVASRYHYYRTRAESHSRYSVAYAVEIYQTPVCRQGVSASYEKVAKERAPAVFYLFFL